MQHILVIDQGTTGSQATLFDAATLTPVANSKVEYPQHYPNPGWVEHDLEELWASVVSAVRRVTEKAAISPQTLKRSLLGIGITNQRETVCPFDRRTGAPLARAIVWQDRRTAEACQLVQAADKDRAWLEEETGLVVDPYFSATKMQWLLSHHSLVQQAAADGHLALGTVDSFLIHRLTKGDVFVTDGTNASRTMLYSLTEGTFSDELCHYFNVPRAVLPEIVPSAGLIGTTKGLGFLPDGVPILACLGDQQAALYGHDAVSAGSGKITFGTGSFLLAAVDGRPRTLPRGILCSVAFDEGSTQRYCLEGSVFIAAAALQYLRDQFRWFGDAEETEALATSVERMPGLTVIPAFTGFGAPWWNPNARAAILGLSLGTSRAHVIRATLEAIAHQNVSLVRLMTEASGKAIQRWGVDGGASNNNFLMQFQADVLRATLVRPKFREVTSLGAAKAVRYALSPPINRVPPSRPPSNPGTTGADEFKPLMPKLEATHLHDEWNKAARAVHQLYLGKTY